jgi:hypothetical protein
LETAALALRLLLPAGPQMKNKTDGNRYICLFRRVFDLAPAWARTCLQISSEYWLYAAAGAFLIVLARLQYTLPSPLRGRRGGQLIRSDGSVVASGGGTECGFSTVTRLKGAVRPQLAVTWGELSIHSAVY